MLQKQAMMQRMQQKQKEAVEGLGMEGAIPSVPSVLPNEKTWKNEVCDGVLEWKHWKQQTQTISKPKEAPLVRWFHGPGIIRVAPVGGHTDDSTAEDLLNFFSISEDTQRFAMKIFKDHTSKQRIKKEVYDWIDRLSIFSCTRMEWWFRDWASWTFRYFLTCHLSERYVKCMHTSCIQHSFIQPCMDACTQVHVIKSLANITCFLISKRNLKQQRSISGPPRSHFGCIFLGGNLLTLTLLWTLGMFKNLMLSSSPKVGGNYGCPINPLSQRYWPLFISIPGYLARASQ